MRTPISTGLVAATLAVALIAGPTSARADLVNLSLLASTSSTGPFSSTLQVAASQTYYYEVVEQFAPIGSTAGPTGSMKTLTSLVPGVDGINTLSFTIGDAISTPFAPGTLQNGFGTGLGASGGTTDGNGGLHGIRGAEAPGIFVGASTTTSTVVLTGTFTTASVVEDVTPITISLGWGGASGGFKINDGTTVLATSSTEAGATPYFGYSGLTLLAVPEPASLTLLGTALALTGLVVAGRRPRKAGRWPG